MTGVTNLADWLVLRQQANLGIWYAEKLFSFSALSENRKVFYCELTHQMPEQSHADCVSNQKSSNYQQEC